MGDRLEELPGDDFFDSLPTWAALEAYFKGLKAQLDQTIEVHTLNLNYFAYI